MSSRAARRAACASAARSRAASVRKNRVPGKAPRAACCSHHSEPTLPKSMTIGMVGSISRAYWIMVEEDTKTRSYRVRRSRSASRVRSASERKYDSVHDSPVARRRALDSDFQPRGITANSRSPNSLRSAEMGPAESGLSAMNASVSRCAFLS